MSRSTPSPAASSRRTRRSWRPGRRYPWAARARSATPLAAFTCCVSPSPITLPARPSCGAAALSSERWRLACLWSRQARAVIGEDLLEVGPALAGQRVDDPVVFGHGLRLGQDGGVAGGQVCVA